jgi:hypothetical protein
MRCGSGADYLVKACSKRQYKWVGVLHRDTRQYHHPCSKLDVATRAYSVPGVEIPTCGTCICARVVVSVHCACGRTVGRVEPAHADEGEPAAHESEVHQAHDEDAGCHRGGLVQGVFACACVEGGGGGRHAAFSSLISRCNLVDAAHRRRRTHLPRRPSRSLPH